MSVPSSTPSTILQVELDLFRGPLHTLLDLIERRELPIARVSLAAVADQYVALVRESPALDLDLTAEFLSIAARLLLLKSQALLPHALEDEPAAEAEGEEDLEARLRAYRRFRDGAAALAARQETGARLFGRATPAALAEAPSSGPSPLSTVMAVPLRLDPARLRRAALRTFARAAATERARATAPSPLVPFSLVLQMVGERLRGQRHVRFGEVVAEAGDVIMAITMFLAVLELVRRRRVSLLQHGAFGAIELTVERE